MPVFFDAKGKRLYRVVFGLFLITATFGAIVAWISPQAFEPSWRVAQNSNSDFPRKFSSTMNGKEIPIIGSGNRSVLTRVLQADRKYGSMIFVDPFSGEKIRRATIEEQKMVGDSSFVIEHYGELPERQLMLTFDDGPDPIYTAEILDILSREKVPATFFQIGKNIVHNPDVLKRIIREGHMVGNHTITHIDLDNHSDFRNRMELIATDKVIRSVGNYQTRLFRIPKGDPENNPLALLQAQQLGYIHANLDIDTNDWKVQPGQTIPTPQLDGRGHVILMHDGGGDRSATVQMLEKLIQEAKRQGYTFSTLAPLLTQNEIPVKNIQPSIADRATLLTFQTVWLAPKMLLTGLFWVGISLLSAMSILYLIMAFVNYRRQQNSTQLLLHESRLPYVSVIIAAYNEEKVIRKTLSALEQSRYPKEKLEVVVVNDGSSDSTLSILRDYASNWPLLHVVHQENAGKSAALNIGILAVRDESTVIVTLDADTIFDKGTIYYLAKHFVQRSHIHETKPVGAVAGHVKVGNRRNILTAWQSLEYISGICVTRLAEGAMNAIAIVPGACSAWSRQALCDIGGLADDTLAEDADATLQLHRKGYKVVQENDAIAYTEAPETIRALAKQRLRWTFGNMQVMWKHRGMILRPHYGMLGMIALPHSVLSLLIPLIFLPPTVVAALVSILAGDWKSVVLFAAFVMAVHFVISVVALLFAKEKAWHLFIVPIYRLIYEPLRAYLLYASLVRILKGRAVGWNKLERLDSVSYAITR